MAQGLSLRIVRLHHNVAVAIFILIFGALASGAFFIDRAWSAHHAANGSSDTDPMETSSIHPSDPIAQIIDGDGTLAGK